jgi:uridine kinase
LLPHASAKWHKDMTGTRSELVDQLTTAVLELHTEEPTLVAIDGRSAAGKTTLADELAVRVSEKGRPVLRSSLDHFHPPGHKYRSSERRYTPASYYAEGYDYATFRAFVLDPLRASGSRSCRLAFWDSFNDVPFPEHWTDVPSGVIVVIDGIFLLRPDLRQYWDYTIWVDIDWESMLERAGKRDAAWIGSAEIAIDRYHTFWIPTHELYEAETNPKSRANAIVDNRYLETPSLLSTSGRAVD